MPSYSSAERDYNDARTRVSNCRAEVDRRSQDLQGKQAYLAEVKDPRNGRSSKTIKNAEISVKKRIDILSDAKNELEDAMRRENSAQSRLRSEQVISGFLPGEIAARINDNNYPGTVSKYRYH